MLASCDNLTGDIREGPLASAVVYGTLTTAAGTPLRNVRVVPATHVNDDANCRVGLNGTRSSLPVTSDSLGNYRAVLVAPIISQRACVSVRLLGIGSPGATDVIGGGNTTVLLTLRNPPDSVRIDVRIP
jgi:hypothetical protein